VKKIILFLLICLEGIFIYLSYNIHFGILSILFSGIYFLAGLSDLIFQKKQISAGFLILSVLIFIPRIFINYNDSVEKSVSKNTNIYSKPIKNFEKPTLENCETFPKWASKERITCQNNNFDLNKNYNDSLNKYNKDLELYNNNIKSVKTERKLSLLELSKIATNFIFALFIPVLIITISLYAPNNPIRLAGKKEKISLYDHIIYLEKSGLDRLAICKKLNISGSKYYRIKNNVKTKLSLVKKPENKVKIGA
jgi:hypothetical protein